MASPMSISLKAWPSTDSAKLSLPFLISRINEQRGSFRNVSESTLVEEVRLTQTGEEISKDSSKATEASGPEDVKSRRDIVTESREDILKQVAKAHTESAQALDFVSLLLSKYTPRQAEITISPYLKQNLPMGSLGTESLQVPQRLDGDRVQDDKVSLGWKLNALTSTADSLLKSASRLEQEIERETRYWRQVLAVREQGWPICRLPREKHTLGVRYGFAEAFSDFRDRGLAALRRDEDGNIHLDRGSGSAANRVLRVSVVQEQTHILSSVKTSERSGEEVPVETLLLRARNSIYDEELYHELHREARNLTNHGVRIDDGKVSIPYNHAQEIEIDLLSSPQEEDFQSENNICAGIAISLRILLSHAHRQNLRRRIQPPPPIREGKTPRPTYAILAPVLEHVQHHSQMNCITHFLHDVRETCLKAGFDVRFDKPTSPYGPVALKTETNQTDFHATESLINQLTKIPYSSMTAFLPTSLTELKIEIQTSLQPHISGTAYQCTIMSSAPESFIPRMQPVVQFSSLATLQDHVLHLLKLDILAVLASPPGVEHGWTIISPDDAKLSRVNQKRERCDRISILIQRYFLRLNWKKGQQPDDEGTVTWDCRSLTRHGEPNRSLVATIEEIFENQF